MDGSGRDEAAFDEYLSAALDGRAVEPEEYFARHPDLAEDVRERILAIHREATRGAPSSCSPAPADSGLPHDRLGDFRLLRRLGVGGMGTVYEAEQLSLGRHVALKIIRPELQNSPEAVERFRREARAAARLRHEGILTVHDIGEEEGVRFLVMELVPGRDLDEILEDARKARKTISPGRVARWAARIARALEYAHEEGIVHRDVKPSNIRITPEDEPMLVDFGIARVVSTDESKLTQAFVGTPQYAAPEQITGSAVDGRADVYGLGTVVYWCLTGGPPFAGDSADEIIHRVLNTEPVPPRRLDPSIPRDLEVITLKALARNRDRRYADAGELAEDLEALLEFRPIRARPPGPVRRLYQWSRRRPGRAASAFTLLLVLLALSAFLVVSDRLERARIREEAADAVELARVRLDEYRGHRESSAASERELALLRRMLEGEYMDSEEERRMTALEDRLEGFRRERQAAFYEVLEHLRRAERLDPAVRGVDAVRSELYMERWREARDARDPVRAEFYSELVAAGDREGRFGEELRGFGPVTIETDPPDASIHLYRYRELAELTPGGEHRLVPVPIAGSSPVAPGTPCLRVVRGAGSLRLGDLITEVEGHPPLGVVLVLDGSERVERFDRLTAIDGRAVRDIFDVEHLLAADPDGESPETHRFGFAKAGDVEAPDRTALGVRLGTPRDAVEAGGARVIAHSVEGQSEITLPAGLRCLPTVAAVLVTPATEFARTPLRVRLERGEYLAVIRKPGHEDLRWLFFVDPSRSPELDIRLAPAGTTPEGFVPVPAPRGEKTGPYYVMEREVTAAEYLEFLNDPATLAAIDAADRPIRFPRDPQSALSGGYWKRRTDGHYELSGSWRGDWPILGISFEDAVAYAAWRSSRDELLRYSLPTRGQWEAAAGDGSRLFSYGNRFRPKWMKSCFSRPRAVPEPVLRFPRDESPYGLFDVEGGAMEWCMGWYDRGRGLRLLKGGSWARATVEFFRLYGSFGMSATAAGGESGLRLVATPKGEGR